MISRVDDQSLAVYPVIYSLDSMSYPKNPMGRTGVRGRGALNRYGPNHEIMAIVTRWKKNKLAKPIYVERRRLMEFIAVKDIITGLTNIPGEKILGDESKYSVVCRTFMELVLDEPDVEKGSSFTEEDMTSFFASFASRQPIEALKQSQTTLSSSMSSSTKVASNPHLSDLFSELGFIPTMIYRGYIDDPRNTDNAWTEAEIWNFHYEREDFFDEKISNPQSKWREVSSNVRINTNEIISDALKEVAELHNGFFS